MKKLVWVCPRCAAKNKLRLWRCRRCRAKVAVQRRIEMALLWTGSLK